MKTENIQLNNAIGLLSEMNDDSSTPKNVKEKVFQIMGILKEDIDISIRVNKALHELDEIVNENNMQQYTRTQVWNVVSLLEKI